MFDVVMGRESIRWVRVVVAQPMVSLTGVDMFKGRAGARLASLHHAITFHFTPTSDF